MNDLRITAKRLGIILLAIYCPCCLWYLLRLKFHPPFEHPSGAIFTDLEKIQMALVGKYLEEGSLPKEFCPFRDIKSRIDFPRHWSKFGYLHESGVFLYGVPDDIFKLNNGSLCVVDHKSAHPKGKKDPFLPQYEIQNIGYGNIAEVGLDLGHVSRGGIWYWEIQRDEIVADPKKYVSDGRICPPFSLTAIEVEMDYSALDPLLKELKKVWKATVPPEGRDGCKDCGRRKTLNAIENSIELADSFSPGAPYNRDLRHFFARRYEHCAALARLEDAVDLESPSISMMSAWFA